MKLLKRSNFYRYFRRNLSTKPSLYFPIARLIGNTQLLNDDTDIVVDGFPKCGNSFSEAAFRTVLPHNTQLATHCHAPAQILRAVARNLPTILLYRQPDDTIASYMDMLKSDTSAEDLFVDYYTFYERILPVLDSVTCAYFDDMITKFPVIVGKFNQKFDLECPVPVDDQDFHIKVNALRDHHSQLRIGRAPIYSDSYSLAEQDRRRARRAHMKDIVKGYRNAKSRIRAVAVFEKIRAYDLSNQNTEEVLSVK